MEVFYHKTDGGAEYLSVNPERQRFWDGVIARVDGNEFEVYQRALEEMGVTLKIS